jgi:hypothetical protein
VDVELRALDGAAQVALGKFRPLVGLRGFIADQNDAAVEAVLSKLPRGRASGQAGTHDHERLLVHRHAAPRLKSRRIGPGGQRPSM